MDNLTLWILQGIMALIFLLSGFMKSTRSKEQLVRSGQTAMDDFGLGTIRFIGVTETLGAVGLVLPWQTDIMPVLTPIAAALLAAIMVLAAQAHLRRGETKVVPLNIAFMVVLCIIAYSRFKEIKQRMELDAETFAPIFEPFKALV